MAVGLKHDVTYRGPVEMSGWVDKFQSRIKSRHVRRYFRLNNEVLSNHPKLTGPSTWQLSVSKCIVKVDEDACVVSIRLIDREIRFRVATVGQTRRWQEAIRSASRCNIEDFYKMGKELGSGAFGSVCLAFDLTTGEKRAVKIVNRSTNAKELEFVQREINVLLSISHKNIVRTFDIFDERDKIYLVLEYVPGGDFFDYMATRTKLQELPAKVVVWQILEGLKYLHDNNIVHRDIKPENVLIAKEDPLVVQLTDFGFANFLDPSSAAPQTDMKSMVGTGCYMSPEIIDARGHGKPVDLFATGVVLYRVITGRLPFRGMSLQECYDQAMAGRTDFNSREWRGFSAAGKQLCAALLDPQPERRPTATEALVHPWFTEDEEFQRERARYTPGTPKPAGGKMTSLRNITRTFGGGSATSYMSPSPREPRSLPNFKA
jgi:serine/threonine protein kinase